MLILLILEYRLSFPIFVSLIIFQQHLTGLFPPWLNLVLGILFGLMQV